MTVDATGGEPPPIRPERRLWHELPQWAFYAPVALGVIGLLIKYRTPNAPLSANWGLEKGGLFPRSKAAFFDLFPRDSKLVPTFLPIAADETEAVARKRFTAFQSAHARAEDGNYCVLKPDAGFQGRSVHLIGDLESFTAIWRQETGRKNRFGNNGWLLQQYVPGCEVSVFYLRRAPDRPGELVSMTRKRGFAVTGDGRTPIDDLIERRDADRATKSLIRKRNRKRLAEVPEKGETVELVPVRNHVAGATFQDISAFITPALSEAICPVLDRIEGYHYGRLDIRAPSWRDLVAGRDIKVLEANALYSEPVHAYDPKYRLRDAHRIFIGYWAIATEIGLANRRAGKPAIRLRDLLVKRPVKRVRP